jgi:tetratricopeptide (TPR) repeat protein
MYYINKVDWRNYILLPLVILLLKIPTTSAQTNLADSLKNVLESEVQDTSRVLLLAKLSRTYLYSKPDTAMLLCRQGLSLSRKLNYITGEIVSLNMMGSIFNVTGNYPKALELLLEALKKAEYINDQENISRLMTGIGILYSYQGDQRQSINYTIRALSIAEKNKYENRIAVNLINLGDSYEKLDILDSARSFTNTAYDIAVQSKNEDNIAITLNNLGNVYAKMGHAEVAMGNYRLAIPYLVRVDNQETLCETYMGMTRLFQQAGMEDSCLYYARLSFLTAKNGGFTSQVMNASIFLRDYYTSIHKVDSAFFYQSATLAAKDSQFSQEKAREIQSLSFEEMMRQQKIEETKAEEEVHRKHNIQYAIISISLVSFIIVFMLLTQTIVVNERWIRFLGLLGLLLVFEFINLVIHPYISTLTNHVPVWMLLVMVIIASLLIPVHHKLEHWITNKLVIKNKRIRLEAAKRIVEKLEADEDVKSMNEP